MRPARRAFTFGAAALAAMPRAGRAAEQVRVRTSGGVFQAAQERAIFGPFREATGIQVVPVPLSTGKLREMVDAGRVPVDAQFLVETHQLALEQGGHLDRIDYGGMRFTDPADILAPVRRPTMVGAMTLATVLVYNTQAFPAGRHPRSWADFWDVKRFPGPRSLPDIKSGFAELEFALLADGVPAGKLYPLDVDRALRSLGRIRRHVAAFWETGTEAMQVVERGNAVLAAMWNGRAADLIAKGAPLAIEWNQAKRHNVLWSLLKRAPNARNAQRFIDFAVQPKVQAEVARLIRYSPTNRAAHRHLPPAVAAELPDTPERLRVSFEEDPRWWHDNLALVTERWNVWMSRPDA